ncbi:MAG: ABC transporter permease [Bacteroidetes bacterium]|nr:ABC transporter permease [Bacteroidota bacterium]
MNFKQTYIAIQSTLSHNRVLKRCVRVFFIFVTIALLAPFIANDKPLICKYKGHWLFPAFSLRHYSTIDGTVINYNMGKDWKILNTEVCVFPPCSWSPNTIDAENAPRKSPFDAQVITYTNQQTVSIPLQFRHWLGTTQNGNDVLSCLIHGTQVSLSVGIFSMLIAALLGISIGACAGYFQNHTLRISYSQVIGLMLALFLSYFYGIVVRADTLANAMSAGGLYLVVQVLFTLYLFVQNSIVLLFVGKWIDSKLGLSPALYFPLDSVVMRVIEILNSIPGLLLIIALSAIAKPSFGLLILIIGFLSWTSIARLTRAEYLKTKQLDYVTSCKAIGMSHYRIIIRHILPNVLPLILVQIIFGLAGAVLIEASLSFIGVGVPLNTITWGSLLNEARDHFSAWWLVVFPGLCVFTLIYIYNKIATEISRQ